MIVALFLQGFHMDTLWQILILKSYFQVRPHLISDPVTAINKHFILNTKIFPVHAFDIEPLVNDHLL